MTLSRPQEKEDRSTTRQCGQEAQGMLPEPQCSLPGEWPLQGNGKNDEGMGGLAGSSRNLPQDHRDLTPRRGTEPSVAPQLLNQLGPVT